MILKQFLSGFDIYSEDKAYKHLDIEVEQEYCSCGVPYGDRIKTRSWRASGGKHRYVQYWVLLKNGIAVGINENPSHGVSFPIMRIKK